jgi:hypothetical protein
MKLPLGDAHGNTRAMLTSKSRNDDDSEGGDIQSRL